MRIPKPNCISVFWLLPMVCIIVSACNIVSPKPPDPLAKYEAFDQAFQQEVILEQLNNKAGLEQNITNRQAEKIIEEVQKFYAEKDTALVWLKILEGDSLAQAGEVLDIIKTAEHHGLNPEDYRLAELEQLYKNAFHPTVDSVQLEVANKIQLDVLLTTALISLGHDLLFGKTEHDWDIKSRSGSVSQLLLENDLQAFFKAVQPDFKFYDALVSKLEQLYEVKRQGGWTLVEKETKYDEGSDSPAIVNLSKRLRESGYLENEQIVFNSELTKALKSFQEDRGLTPTGKMSKATTAALNETVEDAIDAAKLNLERIRWLPDLGSNHIFVNVPAYHLSLVKNDEPVLEMRTCVGKLSKPTPIFQDEMEYIVFSPVWNIPRSIAREELLDWLHYNPNLLIMNDVEVYYNGYKMNPLWIDWKSVSGNTTSYTFHQKPSQSNSMGDAKFMFPNRYSIYIHDTPHKSDFKDTKRAYSAGCIRVAKPVELAYQLLENEEKWNENSVKAAMKRGSQKRANLPEKMPVYLYYLTAWVDDEGHFNWREDIYGHNKKQWAKLNQSR